MNRRKEVQLLQEENRRLRNGIKVIQGDKEKVYRELFRVRDEHKISRKIKVDTEI